MLLPFLIKSINGALLELMFVANRHPRELMLLCNFSKKPCSSFHHCRLNVAMQYREKTERTPSSVCRSALRILRRSARSPVANALRNDAGYRELGLREPSNKRNARIAWRCDTIRCNAMRCFPRTKERLASSWDTRENSRPDAPKKRSRLETREMFLHNLFR